MTEIIETIETMPEALRRFILHWGDMGSQWGVNRSVAQIHALLYVSEAPLHAEQICGILGIARSNVSNSLKELIGWKIIKRVPIAGDRRDHFVAEGDVWEIARSIATIRKQREIDPALATLDFCLNSAALDPKISKHQTERLKAMHGFTRDLDRWYGQMQNLPTKSLLRLIRMGDKIVTILGFSKNPKPPN
jgi:DNA-binding transcriptional regulator GbsR (MarR family)